MQTVIMYNNVYYNLTSIATASDPCIYDLDKIPNKLEYTKQEWRSPISYIKTNR